MYKVVFTNSKEVVDRLFALLYEKGHISSEMMGIVSTVLGGDSSFQPAVPFALLSEAEALAEEGVRRGIPCDVLSCTEREQEYWLARLKGWDWLLKQRLAAKGIILPDGFSIYDPDKIVSMARAFPWDAASRVRMAALLLFEDKPLEAVQECREALAVADEYERATGKSGWNDNERKLARYLLQCAASAN